MIKNKVNMLFRGSSGDSFFLIIVRLVTMVLGLAMTRVLSGHFSKLEYGTYSQITLLVSTVSSFTILGMADGINFFFCGEKDQVKKDSYVATIFTLQYIVSIISSLVLLICAVPISNYFSNDAIRPLMIFAAVMPVMHNTISLLQIMFISIGKAKLIAVKNFFVSVLKLIGIILACHVFDTIVALLVCSVILELLQIAYFAIILYRNNCKVRFRLFDKNLIRRILLYCVPVAMFTIINSLNRDCDKYVISAFTNTETLSIYTNASKLLPFDIIMVSFSTVLLPHITRYVSEKKYEITKNLYKTFIELSYSTTGILTVGAICVAPELMRFLYTEKYLSGLNVFIVYILVDLVRFLGSTLLLSASGKTKSIMYVALGSFAINIIFNILCYKFWGIIGPAVVTLFVTFINGIMILLLSAKELTYRIFDFFDFKYLLLFIVELLVCVTVTVFVRNVLNNVGINCILVLFICYALFGVMMLILNLKRILGNLNKINSYTKSYK